MKAKEYELIVKIRFNRPVTRQAALRAARNQFDPIGVNAYATIAEEERDGWTEMRVKRIGVNPQAT